MGQAGTLLQPGHKLSWVQGGQRINNINIYTGIVISASHSLDLISRAPHPAQCSLRPSSQLWPAEERSLNSYR